MFPLHFLRREFIKFIFEMWICIEILTSSRLGWKCLTIFSTESWDNNSHCSVYHNFIHLRIDHHCISGFVKLLFTLHVHPPTLKICKKSIHRSIHPSFSHTSYNYSKHWDHSKYSICENANEFQPNGRYTYIYPAHFSYIPYKLNLQTYTSSSQFITMMS